MVDEKYLTLKITTRMLSVTGTVIKKKRKYNKNKAYLLVRDTYGNIHSFQVRINRLIKIIDINEGDILMVYYRIETGEILDKMTKEYNYITNEILMDLKLL